MRLRHQIEQIRWVGSHRGTLLVRGWLIAAPGQDIPSLQLHAGARRWVGSYGLPRPDVAQAHPTVAEATFSGFSFLASVEAGVNTVTVIASIAEGSETAVATIPLDPVEFVNLPLVDAERAGLTAPDAAGTGPHPVLFIGHDFACAGAQLLLLRELRWLKARTDLAFEILLAVPRRATQQAGAHERRLLEDLAALCPVHFLSDATGAPENLRWIQSGRYRLLYANTATLGWLLPALRPLSCPVVSHVHELGFWIERRTGLGIFGRQRGLTDRFIACSTAVRNYLAGPGGVAAEHIEVIHECGSLVRADEVRRLHTRAAVRAGLGIDDSTFTIVACGTFDWRKGAELFLPICIALRRHLGAQPFRALWIGDFGPALIRDQFEHDAQTAGLSDAVRLLGHQSEPQRLMLAADCFALPSREDPFPLVMLEAATLGLPIVGFRNSGGVVEFVGEDAGLLADYLDIDAFARALATLARDPDKVRQLGENARHRVATKFDEAISFRRIHALVESVAGSTGPL